MKHKSIIAGILIFLSNQSFGQTYPNDLYMPVEIKKAYEKGTRKSDGTLSPGYWQNHSVYKLGNTSIFIAYRYPEMVDYDDIDGMDRIVYNAATEFYHDYADYEIEIKVPDNFLLWASVADP